MQEGAEEKIKTNVQINQLPRTYIRVSQTWTNCDIMWQSGHVFANKGCQTKHYETYKNT